MEILIIKLSAIGDVIHTLPALELLRRSFPDSRITWVIEEKSSAIVDGHPSLARVIVSRRTQWLADLRSPTRWPGVLRDVRLFVRELRTVRYDLVIDFQGLLKSAALVTLSRGSHKVGYDKTRELSHLVLNHKLSPPSIEEHAVIRNRALAQALGEMFTGKRSPAPTARTQTHTAEYNADRSLPPSVRHNPAWFRIAVSEADCRGMVSLLHHMGVDSSKPLILLNAPAGWETKRWDMRSTAALADLLIEQYDAHIIYTGASGDEPYVRGIITHMRNPASNAAGRTTLKELACLMKRAQLVISTDSGPMHLASAVGTPVVALFGPTAPWRTGPYTDRARIVRKQVPCAPCFKKECSSRICMVEITLEDVMRAVEELACLKKA